MSNDKNLGVLNIDSSLYRTRISSKYEKRKKYVPADPNIISSYIPGTVLEILVSPGSKVTKGEDVMILESMKMKNRIKSNASGTVNSIEVAKGAKVGKGDILITLN
ncbi:MAG TPA: acetyl-CoA carboxylase biotin carboxyl carrier protein subunit [Bacteroidales bacterium]|nr:acetyl-CoA carboxylase biotin carboxyl carrier protein subunit [Bacteroidales bacterium]